MELLPSATASAKLEPSGSAAMLRTDSDPVPTTLPRHAAPPAHSQPFAGSPSQSPLPTAQRVRQPLQVRSVALASHSSPASVLMMPSPHAGTAHVASQVAVSTAPSSQVSGGLTAWLPHVVQAVLVHCHSG